MATEKKAKFGSDVELSRGNGTNQKRATKKGYKAVLISEPLDFTPEDIPDHVIKLAAMASIDLTLSILRMPGGREMLDAETAARKARQAAQREKEKQRRQMGTADHPQLDEPESKDA